MAVARLVRREIVFVRDLVEAATPEAVASAQRAYRVDALSILDEAAVAAAKSGQSYLMTTVWAAREHIRRWRVPIHRIRNDRRGQHTAARSVRRLCNPRGRVHEKKRKPLRQAS